MRERKSNSIKNVTEKREEELDELSKIFETLEKDISDIYPYEKAEGEISVRYKDPSYLNERDRRSLVRSIFAFLEGTCFCLRRTLVRNFKDDLSATQIMALQEEQIEIDASGRIDKKQAKITLLKLIRLTALISADLFPSAKGLECKGPKFEALVRATKIRDRLMHPRSSKHLEVSDDEIRDTVSGYLWFHSLMVCILIQTTKSLESLVKELKSQTQISPRKTE